MQSELSNYTTTSQNQTKTSQTNKTNRSIFTGEINTELLNRTVRHMKNVSDKLHVKISTDSVTLASVSQENTDNTQDTMQEVTIDAEHFNTYSFTRNTDITGVIELNEYVYDACRNHDKQTVSIRLLQENPREEKTKKNTRLHLQIGDAKDTHIVRQERNACEIPNLTYGTSVTIENLYPIKSWLQGRQNSDKAVLITTGSQFTTSTTYSIGFTELHINPHSDDWKIGDRFRTTKQQRNQQNTDSKIVSGTISPGIKNTRCVEHMLADELKKARNISWDIYRLDNIYNVFNNMLKHQLTDAQLQLEMIGNDFPVQLTYQAKSTPHIKTVIAPITHPFTNDM